jgi:hypothetical protein
MTQEVVKGTLLRAKVGLGSALLPAPWVGTYGQ